jgi:hypothetical protein
VDWGTVLRREWGAFLFVLTVVVGLVAVPLALYFNGQKPAQAVAVATANQTPASAPRVASAAATQTPKASPTP